MFELGRTGASTKGVDSDRALRCEGIGACMDEEAFVDAGGRFRKFGFAFDALHCISIKNLSLLSRLVDFTL